MATQKLSTERAIDAQRQVRSIKAVELATQGWTYKAIGMALGVTSDTARDDVLDTLEIVSEERRAIGKKFVDVQLGILYKALGIALDQMSNGVWQQGRTVVALAEQINRILDVYPRDGLPGAGLPNLLQLSFSNTNVTTNNVNNNAIVAQNQTGVERADDPVQAQLNKIRELVNQAKQVAEAVNANSPEQPVFGSDNDLELVNVEDAVYVDAQADDASAG